MASKTRRALCECVVIPSIVAMMACQAHAAKNYIINGDMEIHWTNAQAMQLTYTGSGSDCRLQIDVANHRFRTIVDGSTDINVDLSDRVNYEEQLQLISYLNATGRYIAGTAPWIGYNYGCDGWAPTSEYTDAANGLINLKGNVANIPEGNPSYWAGYGQSTSGSSMFAHSGKYSLQVYDNRPDNVPGSPLYVSPESVNMYQTISNDPNWTKLKGRDVILSGWAFAPSNSWQNAGSTPGYLVRVVHGAGGSISTDLSAMISTDEWVPFQYQFTVDSSSDSLKILLFAKSNINQVYYGSGAIYFDDLSLSLPALTGDINGDGTVNLIDISMLAANWLQTN